MSKRRRHRRDYSWEDEEEVRRLLGEPGEWDDISEEEWDDRHADRDDDPWDVKEDNHARTKLRDLGSSSRRRFIGIVSRFGFKTVYGGHVRPTVLLKDVRLAEEGIHGTVLTDHLWFEKGVQCEELGCGEGDLIAFDARVSDYIKGYRGWRDDVYGKPVRRDYRLGRPTKFAKLSLQDEKARAEETYRSALQVMTPDGTGLTREAAAHAVSEAAAQAEVDRAAADLAAKAVSTAKAAALKSVRL